MPDLEQYIKLTTMMIIATKDEEGNPYTSNLYFKYDENYKFYFHSKISREHSKHILDNGKIAWSVLNIEKYNKPDKDKKGLQFQGIAKILKEEKAEEIEKKLFRTNKTYQQMQEDGQYIFECIPTKVKVWNEEIYNGDGKIFDL